MAGTWIAGDVITLTCSNTRFPSLACRGGDSDDYVQVDDAAVAFKADTAGTFTAWVNIPTTTGSYTIVGYGDDNVVEFMQFSIEAGLLTGRVTDNTVAQWVVQADNIEFTPHKWHHVAMVQSGTGAIPKFYVDGKEIAVTADTSTALSAWGSALGGLDKGCIGAANKSGDSSITVEFAGGIHDVKYWASALTDAQISDDYVGNVLTGYRNRWTFNDDLLDDGSGADNGTAVGDVYLDPSYCELTSRMFHTFGTSLTVNGMTTSNSGETVHAVLRRSA